MLNEFVTLDSSRRIIFVEGCPRSFSDADYFAIIDYAFSISDQYAYLFFSSKNQNGAVLFCGQNERFRTAKILRDCDLPCLVVQDAIAPWYTGSTLCAGMNEVKAVISKAFFNANRFLMIGQSSGGYAAILASTLVASSIVLAFSPQTFDDTTVKSLKMHSSSALNIKRTHATMHDLVDLRDLLNDTPRSPENHIFVLSSYSEHENPAAEWLWIDALHWGRIADCEHVQIFLLKSARHVLLQHRASYYAAMISDIAKSMHCSKSELISIVSRCLE